MLKLEGFVLKNGEPNLKHTPAAILDSFSIVFQKNFKNGRTSSAYVCITWPPLLSFCKT